MDHSTQHPRNDDPAEGQAHPTGLGWAEFFQWLGRSAGASDRGTDPSRAIED